MSKIDDLISKKIEVTFMDEKYTLDSGFTLEETPAIQLAFGQQVDEEVRANGMKMLLKIIAKRLFPDASDEKIAKIDAKYIADILDVFYQLDESTDEDMKRIKKILAKRKVN